MWWKKRELGGSRWAGRIRTGAVSTNSESTTSKSMLTCIAMVIRQRVVRYPLDVGGTWMFDLTQNWKLRQQGNVVVPMLHIYGYIHLSKSAANLQLPSAQMRY